MVALQQLAASSAEDYFDPSAKMLYIASQQLRVPSLSASQSIWIDKIQRELTFFFWCLKVLIIDFCGIRVSLTFQLRIRFLKCDLLATMPGYSPVFAFRASIFERGTCDGKPGRRRGSRMCNPDSVVQLMIWDNRCNCIGTSTMAIKGRYFSDYKLARLGRKGLSRDEGRKCR